MVVTGTNAFDFVGFSVAEVGDVNGDEFADLIIGAPSSSLGEDYSGAAFVVFGSGTSGTYAGAAYVVFGKQGAATHPLNLSTLNGISGFAIVGVSHGDSTGFSVRAAGDVNGDTIDDLIIGAPGADPNGTASGAS